MEVSLNSNYIENIGLITLGIFNVKIKFAENEPEIHLPDNHQ